MSEEFDKDLENEIEQTEEFEDSEENDDLEGDDLVSEMELSEEDEDVASVEEASEEAEWPQLSLEEGDVSTEMAEQLEEARADFGQNPDEVIEIEELEFVEAERVQSVIESILFASDKPVSIATFKQAFQGTSVKTDQIRRALDALSVEYAGVKRGVTLEEVSSGYQLRTKVDNMVYLRNMIKLRPFKLSGPALETLSIIAYKQPCVKAEIDEIRGVESGHLLRALMEKGLVNFAGKSELPGKPMQYQTTRKFLEIFGLRNIRELPTLSEIDELLPEGIGPAEEKKETLDQLTDQLSEKAADSYSVSEDELLKITSQLSEIETTTQFFEDEKARQKAKRDQERAQDLREALAVGETIESKDMRWLERYDAEQLALKEAAQRAAEAPAAPIEAAAEDIVAQEVIAEEVVVVEEVREEQEVLVEPVMEVQNREPAGATFHPDKAKSSVELATAAALRAFEDDLDEELPFAPTEPLRSDKDDSENSSNEVS